MNEEQKNALERSLHDICQDLDANDILPYLRSKEVIRKDQAQEIMKITNRLRQNMQLIDNITEAGPSAFQEFINALQTCSKEHLAGKIMTHLPSSSPQQLTSAETNTNATFNNQNNQGRLVGAPISGGTVNLGDTNQISQYTSNTINASGGKILTTHINATTVTINQHNDATSQAPTTSQSSSQPKTKDSQQSLERIQKSLKEMYLQRFRKTNPFSLPFTFDIENTWVSLALKEEKKNAQATEDHAELLEQAFKKAKMLIIEGKPATGKTSLMRRLAYEWAKGKQELSHFDLIIYVEFRKVRKNDFESISDLVIDFNKNYNSFIENEELGYLKFHLNNKRNCGKTLLLLDGYDESSLDKQCKELSTYFSSSTLENPLFFNIVLTTRPGYLTAHRGKEGRYIFADVLGFISGRQKGRYISSHFSNMPKKERQKNMQAIANLLNSNGNLNMLGETPLFLTFICLLHERIVDGTLVELYYNIIWWLIDRYQQDFPDRDIPALFGFQNDCSDKFETIQDHYLHFPQLHCLGKMALQNLQENEFKSADCEQFKLQPIIEQVGLLRKEKNHDNAFKLVTSFFFPHRTIQEFLAACYCLCSNDDTSEWLLPDFKLDTSEKSTSHPSGMNEFERFLFRIALSDKTPVQPEKRRYYFESIDNIELDIKFDALNTSTGFNNKLLNRFLLQCTNVQNITLMNTNSALYARNMYYYRYLHNTSTITSKMTSQTPFSFCDLIKLHSVAFTGEYLGWKLEANTQVSFANCPSLKKLKFCNCVMKNSTIVGIATLPAIETVLFSPCALDLATWQSITGQLRNSTVKCLYLTFGKDFDKEFFIYLQKCSNVDKINIAIQNYTICQNDLLSFNELNKLHSLTFSKCTFEANSQLSFANCPSLKNLKFSHCEMKSNPNLGTATLPAIDTVEFYKCKIDLATWQSITDQLRDSSVKCLHLTFGRHFIKENLICLQKCTNADKMEINIHNYTIRQNDLFSFSDLIKLHSLTFGRFASGGCTFEANSQLLFTNCPSLKNLHFIGSIFQSTTNLGIAALPEIDTIQFNGCKIDMATWQSIIDQIRSSSVRCLHFSTNYLVKERHPEFLHNLQKCEHIQQIHTMDHGTLDQFEEEVTANLLMTAQKLPGLTSITLSNQYGERLDVSRRLSERNRERIEKAGRQRNPHFSVKYAE